MSFQQRTLAKATTVLFVASIAVFVLGVSGTLAFGLTEGLPSRPMTYVPVALQAGVEAAFWPFFGAAILSRLDQMLVKSGAAQ